MKKIINNKKGQAVFEFIIFMPFLMVMYSIIYTIGNSVSGSINQQKATRGYYYSLVRGNSYVSSYTDLLELSGFQIDNVGFSAVGWREKSANAGKNSFAPCFSFTSLMKSGVDDECDTRDKQSESSRHIRLYTFYGVCGPRFTKVNNDYVIHPEEQGSLMSCSLSR